MAALAGTAEAWDRNGPAGALDSLRGFAERWPGMVPRNVRGSGQAG
jgi:hypothetical protein